MPPAPSFEAKRPPRHSTASLVVAPEVRRSLLELVQLALAVATGGADASALDQALEGTQDGGEPGMAFVTLTEDGALRGCMGNLEPTRRLGEAVVMSAVSAALDDPRFRPVTAAELPAIHVEISVLGLPAPIADLDSFQAGVDGVLVERNGRRGLLLPEVATEFSWGATEMFDAVCRKAGLARGAWRDPTTRLRTFRTVRFGGPATGGL